jgi:hypothetical protein
MKVVTSALGLLVATLAMGVTVATATKNYYCTFVGKANVPGAPQVLVIQASYRASDCAASRRQQVNFSYSDGIHLRAGYVALCGHILKGSSSVWEAIYAKAGTQAEVRPYFCGPQAGWRLVAATALAKLVSESG